MNIDVMLLNRFLTFKFCIAAQALNYARKKWPEEFVNDG